MLHLLCSNVPPGQGLNDGASCSHGTRRRIGLPQATLELKGRSLACRYPQILSTLGEQCNKRADQQPCFASDHRMQRIHIWQLQVNTEHKGKFWWFVVMWQSSDPGGCFFTLGVSSLDNTGLVSLT